MKDQTGLRRISIVCFAVMLVMFVIHVQILTMFNRQEKTVHGNDSSSTAYMEIDPRSNSTSSWLKRDFPLAEEQQVDLIGQTIDMTLYNNSGDGIRDWGLRINVAQDCFINQAWTGETEIHQFGEDGRETVQRLDLRDYTLEDVKLEYRYDGDLLIPLKSGDYVIYYPNEHYTEMPVQAGEKVTIGMIFYYLGELNLSDYDLNLHFHRGFAQGWSFITFIVMAALWILTTVAYLTSVFIYRNARKQMELRKSGLSCMSELYEAIYIINLSTGEVTPASTGAYLEDLRKKHHGARELLQAAVRGDADEKYLEATLAFVDTDTLAERLKDRESIVWEFVSSVYGWCRFRFFAMDHSEDKPVENVIFAVQDINDERSAVKKLADRLEKAEDNLMAGSDFLSGAYRDLQAPVQELLDLDEKMMRETDPEKMKEYAGNIHGTADRMLTLLKGLRDRAAAEAGQGAGAVEAYSLKALAEEAFGAVRPMAEERGIRLEQVIPDTLPDALLGDAGKLKETLVSMLANILDRSTDGTVRLSVFGKTGDGSVHLLFSVQAVPEKEEASTALPGRKALRAVHDLNLEVAESVLAGLGSGLKSVCSSDAWQDLYFETDQRIAEEASEDEPAAEETKP